MEQNNKDDPEQEPITIALTLAVPEKLGWSIVAGDNSCSGDSLKGLVQHLADTAIGSPATLSISLLFELTGDGETIRSSSSYTSATVKPIQL